MVTLANVQEQSWLFDLTAFDSVWKVILQIALLLVFLLIGNALRRVIPFLRKAFIPSALLGGLLLFITNLLFNLGGIELVDRRIMQIITYHALAVGFIASSLKLVENKTKIPFIKSVQNGAITGATYMIQAVVGLGVSLIFFAINNSFFYDAGVLLPLGFGQGPGNALTWDLNFTADTSNSFNGQGSVGLTIASIGFLVASIVGIIYINIYRRKGQIVHKEVMFGRKVEDFELENEIEDSESVDKFSIQIGLVLACYAASFLIMVFFAKLTEWTGVNLFNSLAWGFNFIWGVIVATLVKLLTRFLMKKKIVKRRYINNYQMDRISGFAFDLMIIAGVAAIDIKAVGDYIWFIVALSAAGTIVTIFLVRIFTKMCFKKYEHEAFLVNFGTLTGTASNGMIFLREIDPNYETPMNTIFIVSQLPAMIFVAPLLLLLQLGANSFTNCLICLGIYFALTVAYIVFLTVSSKKLAKKEG